MLGYMLLLAVILPAGVADGQTVASTDQRFVRDLHDKDIDDVLTLYTPDAVFVNPDGTQATGAGLRALYELVAKTFDSDLHLHPGRVRIHGKLAVEDGSYTEALGHRDTGKVDNVHGTYRFELRREADGRWRYTRMEWH